MILASGSPRRKELLQKAGLDFEVVKLDFDESIPDGLSRQALALHLAQSKSAQCADLAQDHIVITADTIVCVDDRTLNKPADRTEALDMLRLLCGRDHEVVTGICVRHQDSIFADTETTVVTFADVDYRVLEYYVDHYQPYDKAGAYGIQEWIGMVAISGIRGDYYNVVGLPVRRLLGILGRYFES